MSRLPYFLVTGSVALLVACEPLPSNPPPGQRLYPPYGQGEAGFGQGQRGPEGQQGDDPGPEQIDGEVNPPPIQDKYPKAVKTETPNVVISPYYPYNEINVEGFRSGQLAKDPSDKNKVQIFRVP